MSYLIARYWPHALIVAVTATIVAFSAYSIGAASGDRRAAKAELALSHVERDTAYRLAEAETKAREAERKAVERIAEIEAAQAAKQERIESEVEARTRDLRTGNLRLRREIAALATASVSREAAAAAESEAAAARGAELIAAAVGVGAACDARVQALIDAYEATP